MYVIILDFKWKEWCEKITMNGFTCDNASASMSIQMLADLPPTSVQPSIRSLIFALARMNLYFVDLEKTDMQNHVVVTFQH